MDDYRFPGPTSPSPDAVGAPETRALTPIEQRLFLERRGQGLPDRIEDPVILRRVAALIAASAAEAGPLLVGVREAATELGLGRDTTYRLVREGRLRSVRMGRRLLIPRTELAAFIERES